MYRAALAALLLILSGCASSNAVRFAEPEITIHTLDVLGAQPESSTQFSTVVRLDVANRAGAPIVVERIVLGSVGTGAYNIATTERDFHRSVAPDELVTLDVWARAVTVAGSDEVLVQREGPIMIRGTLLYSHPGGSGRKVFVQRVPTSNSQPRND